MRERKMMPSHPGGILKRLYLDALAISNSQFADSWSIQKNRIQNR